MELTWREYAKLYAPFALYAAVLVVGAIYALGYRNGMRSLLEASATAANDAR